MSRYGGPGCSRVLHSSYSELLVALLRDFPNDRDPTKFICATNPLVSLTGFSVAVINSGLVAPVHLATMIASIVRQSTIGGLFRREYTNTIHMSRLGGSTAALGLNQYDANHYLSANFPGTALSNLAALSPAVTTPTRITMIMLKSRRNYRHNHNIITRQPQYNSRLDNSRGEKIHELN
jgi:hypothetical protein